MSPARTPFVIAHRAGNDLAALRRAETTGARLVEADLHLFAGRVEVRHLKTVGPIPLLWDKWTLAPPWRARLGLDELLAAAAPSTELMLDLKGSDPRLSERVIAALDGRVVSVCSQCWPLLAAFADVRGVRVVHSVGSARALARLRARGERLDGVSIHKKLLDPATVAALNRTTGMLMTWPVTGPAEAERLGAWGVDGVITERFEDFVSAPPERLAA